MKNWRRGRAWYGTLPIHGLSQLNSCPTTAGKPTGGCSSLPGSPSPSNFSRIIFARVKFKGRERGAPGNEANQTPSDSTHSYTLTGDGTWEHLIVHLERKLHPDFKMSATILERKPVGDILLLIVREWSKVGDRVTVREFCDFSKNQLKIGRVKHILSEAERDFVAFSFSEDFSTPRPGDSFPEHV